MNQSKVEQKNKRTKYMVVVYLASTRFNTATYNENTQYKLQHQIPAIYGSSFKISNACPHNAPLFLFEMNNETNKIEGISLLRNKLVFKYHKIHKQSECNRFIYMAQYWLSRDQVHPSIIKMLDILLFKGKSHCKYLTGITILSSKVFNRWELDYDLFCDKLKLWFIAYLKQKKMLPYDVSLYESREDDVNNNNNNNDNVNTIEG